MIDILYNAGDGVWRESAVKVFSLHINTLDAKTKEPVSCGAIACVKEDDIVYVFTNMRDSIDDYSDLITMATSEVDLRAYELFAAHRSEDFLDIIEGGKMKIDLAYDNGTIVMAPPGETRDRIKEEKNAKRREKRAAEKAAKAASKE